MRLLVISIASLYLLFISFYFFGDDIKKFFIDEVALLQAEAETQRAENQKIMLKNNHEKDLILLENQYRREMSEIFNSRFLSWGIIIFLGLLVVVLLFHVCRQNATFANALAKNCENLQKTTKHCKNDKRLAPNHRTERIT